MYIFSSERINNLKILERGLRNDGRTANKSRSLCMLLSPKGNSCDLRNGNTRIIISSFIQPVANNEINKSYLKYSFEIRIHEKNIFENTKGTENLNHLIINNIIRTLDCIFKNDKNCPFRKSKCFSEEVSWVFKFKIFVIENQGNLKDNIVLGVSLLLNFLNKHICNTSGQNLNIHNNYKNDFIYTMFQFSLSFSFSLIETHEGEYLMLFDPSHYEEYISLSILTVILTNKNEITYIFSGTGPGLSESIIKEAIRISIGRNNQIKKILKKVLCIKCSQNFYNELVFINE